MNLVDLAVIFFVGSLGTLLGVIGCSFIVVMMKTKKKIVYVGPMKVKEYIAIIGLNKNKGPELIYTDPAVGYVELDAGSYKDFLRDRKDYR